MRAGWCCRTVRAAVFAAVCVLLAALGHLLMSGAAVPWWAVAAGASATGTAAWWLAGRERGPAAVVLLAVAAQTVLHAAFSLAQATAHPGSAGDASLVRRWLDVLLCRMPSPPGAEPGTVPMPTSAADHGGHAVHAAHGMGATDATAAVGHAMGGMSPSGMLAAHLVAALLCGLWLAHGERAAFRIVRSLAARLVAPLRLPLRPAAPPHRPRVRPGRAASDRAPRRLTLAHAITSRGPPARSAVA
ncbi:hypothetical protein ACFUVV_32555 [Streptomyces sp. NPDC057376]|uniref:hypothetical protein n=1 Tax=unclassified Streptomyces TaxID=2593676 RepID=UPI00093D41A6|nr:hypothetical protein [Streptomyces sp. CB02414]OKI85947.1 hypothetical protein AMK11_13900 [Streptomyces sp. CB02414]